MKFAVKLMSKLEVNLNTVEGTALKMLSEYSKLNVPVVEGQDGPSLNGCTGFLPVAEAILNASPYGNHLRGKTDVEAAQVDQWSAFVVERNWKVDDASSLAVLNQHLETRTYFAGHSLSTADLVVYSAAHAWMTTASEGAKIAHYHIVRWFDQVQHLPGIEGVFLEHVPVETSPKKKADPKKGGKTEAKGKANGKADKKAAKAAKPVKTRPPAPPLRESDDVTRIALTVGQIVEIREHPGADKMFVEKIDCGEGELREICSGLKGLIPMEELLGQRCIVVSNLKAKNLRGIKSNGMVLCATSQDHSQCELMQAPEGVPVGELLRWGELPGEPERVIPTPKGVNAFAECAAHLNTDAECRGRWKDMEVLSSKGPIRCSSLCNAIMS